MTSYVDHSPVAARIAACLATDLPGDLFSAQLALSATVKSWFTPSHAKFGFDLASTENYVNVRGTVGVDGVTTVEFARGDVSRESGTEYLLDLAGLLDYIEARAGGMPSYGYPDAHWRAQALKSSLFFNPSPELLEKFSNEFFWEGEGVSSVADQIGGWLYIAKNFDEACAKAEAYVDRDEKV